MVRESKAYLEAVIKPYCEDLGVPSLPFVDSPSTDDKFDDDTSLEPSKQAKSASSHLMPVLYIARLCRGDLITTTSSYNFV